VTTASGSSNTASTAITSAAAPVGRITGYQGLCMDDRGALTANYNPIQVYTCDNTSAQQWTVESYGTLQVLGMCMDVNGRNTSNGTVVDLYTLQRHRRSGLGRSAERRTRQRAVRQMPGRQRLRRFRHPADHRGLRRRSRPEMDAALRKHVLFHISAITIPYGLDHLE